MARESAIMGAMRIGFLVVTASVAALAACSSDRGDLTAADVALEAAWAAEDSLDQALDAQRSRRWRAADLAVSAAPGERRVEIHNVGAEPNDLGGHRLVTLSCEGDIDPEGAVVVTASTPLSPGAVMGLDASGLPADGELVLVAPDGTVLQRVARSAAAGLAAKPFATR